MGREALLDAWTTEREREVRGRFGVRLPAKGHGRRERELLTIKCCSARLGLLSRSLDGVVGPTRAQTLNFSEVWQKFPMRQVQWYNLQFLFLFSGSTVGDCRAGRSTSERFGRWESCTDSSHGRSYKQRTSMAVGHYGQVGQGLKKFQKLIKKTSMPTIKKLKIIIIKQDCTSKINQ